MWLLNAIVSSQAGNNTRRPFDPPFVVQTLCNGPSLPLITRSAAMVGYSIEMYGDWTEMLRKDIFPTVRTDVAQHVIAT